MTPVPLRSPKAASHPRKCLYCLHIFWCDLIWEMWVFSQAPALFVTKIPFARKITSCVRRPALADISGDRRVRARNHFSHQSSAVRLGFTKRHFNKVTLLSAPLDKISPGWQMLLTSAWNETRKVNERGDMGGKKKIRCREAWKILHMLLYLPWFISQRLRTLWGGKQIK